MGHKIAANVAIRIVALLWIVPIADFGLRNAEFSKGVFRQEEG